MQDIIKIMQGERPITFVIALDTASVLRLAGAIAGAGLVIVVAAMVARKV